MPAIATHLFIHKKLNMHLPPSLRILLTSAALASSVVLVQAQATEPSKPEQYHNALTERLEQLKAQLKLSADQQTAWQQYLAVVQPVEHPPEARADTKTLSEAQKAERRQQRQERQQRQADAAQALKAQLSPEQQTIFDKETAEFQTRRDKEKRQQ